MEGGHLTMMASVSKGEGGHLTMMAPSRRMRAGT